MPKTLLGRVAVILAILMPILFVIGSIFANTVYKNVAAEDTALLDLNSRPGLAYSMFLGMLCGVGAFVTGLLAIFGSKERSILVYIAAAVGGFLLLMLAGELIFTH